MLSNDDLIIGGGRHESKLEGYNEDIKSKDIVNFTYNGINISLHAKKIDNQVEISCTGGGNTGRRDGTYFIVHYKSDDISILKKLQEIIDRNNEIRGNGFCTHVDGLPAGIGDLLSVEYETGEKIYKTSNQELTVTPNSINEFYIAFHEFVLKDGYDFTSEGSNVQLYDDADIEYLQGTWKGKHFGSEIIATFKDNKVTISEDGKITDDNVEYIIFEGTVKLNKLKEGIEKASSYHDYEDFNAVSSFSKKNWFTMTAYFTKDSYSTCDMHNFDKEKPENEK